MIDLLDYEQYSQKIMSYVFRKRMEDIGCKMEPYKDIMRTDFLNAFNHLLQEGIEAQQYNLLNDVDKICIFFLKSSFLTKKYEYQITLYDERFYFERWTPTVYWVPSHLIKLMEEDIEQISSILKKEVIGIGYAELEQVRLSYVTNYNLLVLACCKNFINQIDENKYFKELGKGKEFHISFGGFMSNQLSIYEYGSKGCQN